MEVIYSDEDIIVINKPPGISVHGGDSVVGPTVVDDLVKQFPEIVGVGDPPDGGKTRPGLVHRLDRDTSGIMVVARNQKSFLALKEIFQKRLASKTYQAIVCGAPRAARGVIDFPIGREARNPTKRGAVQGRNVIRGARDALTEYEVLKTGDQYSLVELRPKTGRMHQLRVHMKALGYPIACDTKYGGKKVCCPPGCGRQMLHARSLSFSYPQGRKLHFEADPPEDFVRCLKILKLS